MNKEYILRELILNELGFPMNKDIQEYLNIFNELISKKGDSEKIAVESRYNLMDRKIVDGKLYYKDDIKLLFYDETNQEFWVDYSHFWEKFFELYGYKTLHVEARHLFSALLENHFKLKVNITKCGGYIKAIER